MDRAQRLSALWAEMCVWLPTQTERIEKRPELKRVLYAWMQQYDLGVLLAAWESVKARPTVYASESIPALLTQAIGDRVAEQVGSPEAFEAWVLRAVGNPEIEDTPPRPAFIPALRCCPSMWDLKRMSPEGVVRSLGPGKDFLRMLAQERRVQAVERPSSVRLADDGALLLTEEAGR